ncbi:MAG TPA: TadE/TadG family type IV pilus assembly protein [Caulobacteraceae bacterium]|nr:TadE/TadG family type IV pilus assembly protein [Caulobacteraceae bacterium]
MLRDLYASERGATAVEFAMIALPFFALLFSILELGMMFMTATTIEAATVSAARQIRTGQVQTTGTNTTAGFKALVCNGMSWISTADCMANMSIDVRTFPSFAAVTVTPPVKNNQIDQTQLTYDAGSSCDIVLVRAFYPYTLITPLLEPGLPNLGANQRLITTAVAFRNEDWQAEGPPCT